MKSFEYLGFVPIDEIQSTFTQEFRAIEDDIRINGMPHDHRIVVEWIDNIRLRLLQRARHNLDSYIKQNPHVRKEAMQVKAAADQEDTKRSWKDRVAQNKARALKGEE